MHKKTLLSIFFTATLVILPLFVSAQNPTSAPAASACRQPNDIGQLFTFSICLISKYVIPFLFALALVMFIVGVLKYVKSGDNEEAREAGRGLMLFGIIALFVMTSVWGLVKILYSTIFPASSFEMPALPPQSTTPFK